MKLTIQPGLGGVTLGKLTNGTVSRIENNTMHKKSDHQIPSNYVHASNSKTPKLLSGRPKKQLSKPTLNKFCPAKIAAPFILLVSFIHSLRFCDGKSVVRSQR